MIWKNLKVLWPLFLIIFLQGCEGLPEYEVKKAKELPTLIEQTQNQINKEEESFGKLKTTSSWGFLKTYNEKENWGKHFQHAREQLSRAQRVYDEDISLVLSNDKPEDANALSKFVQAANVTIFSAKNESEKAQKRMDFLLDAKNNSSSWKTKAEWNLAKINNLVKEMEANVFQVKRDYPKKAIDLLGRFAPIHKNGEDAKRKLDIIKEEYAKISSSTADYAKLADSVTEIEKILKIVKLQSTALTKKMNELYRSYSKTLVDMKIDYRVRIERVSWDNFYDSPTEHSYVYSRDVSAGSFEILDSAPDGKIASRISSWGSWHDKTFINPSVWKSLKINMGKNWSSDDDEAEFYVSDLQEKTYLKFAVVENGVKTLTDWILVGEDDFWANEEYLGMTIHSKPYGMYEDEAFTAAFPVGMEYLAEPTVNNGVAVGSNRYGEWRQDSSGHSFWHYYGQYSFMRDLVGPSNYYYSDWDYYNHRNRSKPYFGKNAEYGTYGNKTYKNSKYKNSTFVRRNPTIIKAAKDANKSSFSNKSEKPSIRGSGESNRGRGPAGGGK